MIIIKKLLLFFCLFFLFNTLEIDSNNAKVLLYDKSDIEIEDNFKIFFYNINSNKLKSILSSYNIRVLSYYIDGKKYYARNIDELENNYLKDKSINEKIYYYENGIKVDGINVVCQVKELMRFEKNIHFY